MVMEPVYMVSTWTENLLTDGMWLCKWALRFSAAVIPNTRIGVRTKMWKPTKFMPRTPDYYGYFTLTSAPFKNFDMSVSGVYTGRMHVPHLAPDFSVIPENYEYSYIRKDELVHTPDFFDLNLKLNYTFVLNDHIKLQLNGGVQNLFNAFQKDLDKGGFRDSGYFYGPTQPRTYFIGVKITN